MVEHVAIPDDGIHEPKGIASAADRTVYIADGAGSGNWEPLPTPLNEVLVLQESDFGTPVSGAITLQDNVRYLVGDDVVMASRLIVGNSVISSHSSRTATLTYTGTDDFIYGEDTSFEVEQITLACPNQTTGKFAINAFRTDGGPGNVLLMEGLRIASCMNGIRTEGVSIFGESVPINYIENGVDCHGTINNLDFETFIFNGSGPSSVAIDLNTSVTTYLRAQGNTFNGTGTGLAAPIGTSNLTPSGQAALDDNVFSVATPLSGITSNTAKFEFNGNVGVANSRNTAQGNIVANATATTFGAADVAVKANFGTSFVSDFVNRFTINNTGRFTYTGVRQRDFYVSAEVFATVAGGTARDYYFTIAKNGTAITSSRCKRRFDGTSPGSVSTSSVVTLAQNDYVEVFVTPLSHTTSITVETCSLKAFGV